MPPTPRPRRPRAALLVLAALAPLATACSGGDAGGGRERVPAELLATVPADRALAVEARVERVVDGDTFVARVGGDRLRVRLLGVDTPESVKPDSPVECYGPEASHRTAQLLPRGSAVTLETDPGGDRRDDFGRLLAYVTPAGARTTLNEELLREGYADLFVYHRDAPFARVRAFRAARNDARSAGRGLWGACRQS